MVTKTWYINRKNACDWLKATFPDSIGKNLPLKVGIFDEIKAFKSDDKPALIWCRRALRLHTARFSYLRGLTDGAERFDLNGNPSGFVTEREALFAKKQFSEISKKVKKQKQQLKVSKETQKVSNGSDAKPRKVGNENDDFKNRPILTLKKKKPLKSA